MLFLSLLASEEAMHIAQNNLSMPALDAQANQAVKQKASLESSLVGHVLYVTCYFTT